jgi:hypothetical protein
MENCVKTYNVGAQSKDDFIKFITYIKDNYDFDNQEYDTWFKKSISYWLNFNKIQEYAFNKKDFQKSADIYRQMLELKKRMILVWNNEKNFSPIIKNINFCVSLNEDGTSNVSHLL